MLLPKIAFFFFSQPSSLKPWFKRPSGLFWATLLQIAISIVDLVTMIWCIYVHMYVLCVHYVYMCSDVWGHVSVHVCVHVCGGSKLTLGVFLDHSLAEPRAH